MSKKEVFLRIGAGILLAGALFFLVFYETIEIPPTLPLQKGGVNELPPTLPLQKGGVNELPPLKKEGWGGFRNVRGEQFSIQNTPIFPLILQKKDKNNTPDYSEFSHAVKHGLLKIETAPHCGEGSIKCNVPLGCLNFTCRTWPNAIWDPTTGICGCG